MDTVWNIYALSVVCLGAYGFYLKWQISRHEKSE